MQRWCLSFPAIETFEVSPFLGDGFYVLCEGCLSLLVGGVIPTLSEGLKECRRLSLAFWVIRQTQGGRRLRGSVLNRS